MPRTPAPTFTTGTTVTNAIAIRSFSTGALVHPPRTVRGVVVGKGRFGDDLRVRWGTPFDGAPAGTETLAHPRALAAV